METNLVQVKWNKKPLGRTKSQHVALCVACVIFALYALSLLLPFVWLLLNSFKARQDFLTSSINGGGLTVPQAWDFRNYYEALVGFKISLAGAGGKQVNLFGMFLNSILVTATTTALEVFFSAATAYVMAKFNFPGKKIIFGMVLASMVIPVVGTLPVTYRFMGQIHLRDTLPGVWFIYVGGFGFGFLLLYGYFRSLSWGYAEAAEIDGANSFTIFFRIMLPLSIPQLVSLAIITAITYWNDYATPKIYLASMPTVAVGLDALMIAIKKTSDYPLMFSCILVAITPIVVIFCCFQKVIISNMVAGGLKG